MARHITSLDIIEKQSSETLAISMDFTNWLEEGITISSPVISITDDDSTLTIEDAAISSNEATMLVSDGTNGKRYRINVQVNTSDGQVLIGDGILKIRDR